MNETASITLPFGILPPHTVERLLKTDAPPLLLDVRRREGFAERPEALPGAVAFLLDEDPVQIPDVPRDRPIVLYCLCRGEASSARVARWLAGAGYEDVAVLQGGLGTWADRGLPLERIAVEPSRAALHWQTFSPDTTSASPLGGPFLSRLEDQSILRGRDLPLRRDMAVCFIDMADSTRLLATHPTEQVLSLVQAFMEIVVEIGALHCGDVHDFEGDGALLYFEGAGESVPAAFETRRRLLARRCALPDLPLPRIALDAGPLVIGMVGGRFRQGVALVGPCIPRAARILKLAPPGGIITTAEVLSLARESNPGLARQFVSMGEVPPLKGMEEETPELYVAPPAAAKREF